MPGVKTNERPVLTRLAGGDGTPDGSGATRAVLRHSRMSAYKAREVLDLIRSKPVGEALEILRLCGRDASIPIAKLLASAVANAENNEQRDPDELYVSACFADESVTLKRWRPRARGRATRIRKRTCHITLLVDRMSEDQIRRFSQRKVAAATERRARRVAASRRKEKREEAAEAEVAEANAEAAVGAATDEAAEETLAATEAPETEVAAEAEASTEASTETEATAEAEGSPGSGGAAEAETEKGAEKTKEKDA